MGIPIISVMSSDAERNLSYRFEVHDSMKNITQGHSLFQGGERYPRLPGLSYLLAGLSQRDNLKRTGNLEISFAKSDEAKRKVGLPLEQRPTLP